MMVWGCMSAASTGEQQFIEGNMNSNMCCDILKQSIIPYEHNKVSNIHQLCNVIVEERERTPAATCAALVNTMPRRVETVLDNNGGHTKYGHFWTCSL